MLEKGQLVLAMRAAAGQEPAPAVVLADRVGAFLVIGVRLYVAYQDSDVQVFDISDPLHPQKQARLATRGPITHFVPSGTSLLLRRQDGAILPLSDAVARVEKSLVTTPQRAQGQVFEDGEDRPRRHGEDRPRRYGEAARPNNGAVGLLISGSLMFAVPYFFTAAISGVRDEPCRGKSGCAHVSMYAPLLGPFVELGTNGGVWSDSDKGGMAVSGILQCTGIALLISGAVLQARLPRVAPLALRGGGGLLLAGSF